jgi:hypothetical protein
VKYSGQTFEDVAVDLDGNEFDDCTFRKVIFDYSGGTLVMNHCRIESFSFRFGGALSTGLFALYQLFGTEGMLQIIRGFTQPAEGEVTLATDDPPAAAN